MISDEEMRGLDVYLDMNYFYLCKRLMENDQYYYLEILRAIREYYKFRETIDLEDRLEPSGRYGSIMFIGVNPASRSSLKDVWKDTFGKNFSAMLEDAGIDKSKVWMSNLYKKSTPGNVELSEKEIAEGLAELRYEIPYANPSIVVCLGKQVREAVVPLCQELGIDVSSIYHPSYLMRNLGNEEMKKQYLLDLKNFKKYEQSKMDPRND